MVVGNREEEKTRDIGLRTGTDGRNERWPEREIAGLRNGQKGVAGMNDGLNKRRLEGIRVSEKLALIP